MNRILYNLKNVFIVIVRICFMSVLEIEDFSCAAMIRHAAAEHIAALIPADEHGLVGFGNNERLAVHLLMLNKEVMRNVFAYRVIGIDRPYAAFFADFSPLKIAGAARKTSERKRVMRGVKCDKAHTVVYSLNNAVNNFGKNGTVCNVSPPDKDVGIVQNLLRKSVFGHIESCNANFKIVAGKSVFESGMYSFGIYFRNRRLIFLTSKF